MVKLSDRFFGIVKYASKFTAENLVNKRTLARARNARDYSKRTTERNFNINVLEVVLAGSANLELRRILINPHALRRDFNRLATAQVGPRERRLVLLQFFDCARRQNATALDTRARANVNHAVRMTHRILVVFHDEEAVALGSQALQHFEQFIIVTRMQTDTRFVQNIQHALQARTHGACEPDTLRLATA